MIFNDEELTVCDRCKCEQECSDDTVTGTEDNGEWCGCTLCLDCDAESREEVVE